MSRITSLPVAVRPNSEFTRSDEMAVIGESTTSASVLTGLSTGRRSPLPRGDRFRALPRLRRLLLLVVGCLLVRPLDEADNGPAGPHTQEVHRDEK